MKKLFLILTAIVALTSCQNSVNYKAEGERMANRLDQLCEQQDGDAVLALQDSIKAMETEIIAAGDSAAIADFRDALKESRERNAPYITTLKIDKGVSGDEAINEVVEDALNGNVDIHAVSKSVDAALEQAAKKNKK